MQLKLCTLMCKAGDTSSRLCIWLGIYLNRERLGSLGLRCRAYGSFAMAYMKRDCELHKQRSCYLAQLMVPSAGEGFSPRKLCALLCSVFGHFHLAALVQSHLSYFFQFVMSS